MSDLSDRLDYRTWLQLKECALAAIPVLRKLEAEGSAEAAAALATIEHILGTGREGPGDG